MCSLARSSRLPAAWASVARGPDTWLIVPTVLAVVVVVVSLVNHPPGTAGTGDDPMIGIWLALAASVLMLAGLVLSVARISVAVNLADQPPGTPAPGAGFGRERRAPMPPPSASAAPTAPLAGDPRTEPPHAIDNDTPR